MVVVCLPVVILSVVWDVGVPSCLPGMSLVLGRDFFVPSFFFFGLAEPFSLLGTVLSLFGAAQILFFHSEICLLKPYCVMNRDVSVPIIFRFSSESIDRVIVLRGRPVNSSNCVSEILSVFFRNPYVLKKITSSTRLSAPVRSVRASACSIPFASLT